MRTVFHVSTPEQLSYTDAKVENLLADETIEIDSVVVVLDAPGVIDAAAGQLRDTTETILAADGRFAVCSNASRGASRVADLPDGVERVSSAVGELTRLQDDGYAYIVP